MREIGKRWKVMAVLGGVLAAFVAVESAQAQQRQRGGGGGGAGGARQTAPASQAANRGAAQKGATPKSAAPAARNTATVNNTRADARTNNVRSTSVNNVNVERNVNVNVDGGGCCNGWDNDHPVATAAAVGATIAMTSAVIGSIVAAPPVGCVPVNYGGIIYQQCGPTWYQPQGPQYIVVAPPY